MAPPPKNAHSVEYQNWESTFPVDLHLELSSELFVHRLIKVMTSFIMDKRGFLDQACTKTRNIEKLLVPTFAKENQMAKRIVQKLDALRAAISKRYLREFAIVFYRAPDEEDVFEVYSFRLIYNDDGSVQLFVNTGIDSENSHSQNLIDTTFGGVEDTRKQFVNTLKKLHKAIKNLEEFPEQADASFRVSFTEKTPEEYMVDGYMGSKKFYEIDSGAIQMGVLCAGHHRLQLLAASQLVRKGCQFDLNTTINSLNNVTFQETPKTPKKRTSIVNKKRQHPYAMTEKFEETRAAA